jgi:hypothetical protein
MLLWCWMQIIDLWFGDHIPTKLCAWRSATPFWCAMLIHNCECSKKILHISYHYFHSHLSPFVTRLDIPVKLPCLWALFWHSIPYFIPNLSIEVKREPNWIQFCKTRYQVRRFTRSSADKAWCNGGHKKQSKSR